MPAVHTGGTGAHRENTGQRFQGVADRPGLGVRTEIAHALLARPPVQECTRELLFHADREHRVGLVVPVHDVEPGGELLDPGVLEVQRLELAADHRPLHVIGGVDHGADPGLQVRGILEVVRQSGPQVLRLADVEHPVIGVAERVDPRVRRDRTGGGTVTRWISHGRGSRGYVRCSQVIRRACSGPRAPGSPRPCGRWSPCRRAGRPSWGRTRSPGVPGVPSGRCGGRRDRG